MRISDIINPTVRVRAVSQIRNQSHGAVRRGSLLNVFFNGAVPLPGGKAVLHRLFFRLRCTGLLIRRTKSRFRRVLTLLLGAITKRLFLYCFLYVHRIITKPYETSVSHGSDAFSRGINETAVSLRAPYDSTVQTSGYARFSYLI